MERRFYIYKRAKVYYAKLIDPRTGVMLNARAIIGALHERGLSEAYAIKPATESELLIDFLRRFWNWDRSPYIREKLALKHSMTKRRVYDCIIRVNAYWAPAFPDLRLDEVKRKDLKEFVLSLSERGLASGTINSILAWHFYATNMANRIDSRKVMATTGHKTGAVFEACADHQAEEDFLEVAGMTSKVFDFATEAAWIRDNAERRAM